MSEVWSGDVDPRPGASTLAGAGWGWYLYGIIQYGSPAAAEVVGGLGLDHGEPLQVLPWGDLAAVVSRVPLEEFGTEALPIRLQDTSWLEAMVRGHERVVEAIQRERAVLPSRFGRIYGSVSTLETSLRDNHDDLIARLGFLEGCDEWGVRLYADRSAVQARAAAEDLTARQLQDELATAAPGRAYFLKRKLADVLAAATDRSLQELAHAGYVRLASHAVAAQPSPRPRLLRTAPQELEVLGAAFLVRRANVASFVEEIRRIAAGREGWRAEYTGPWPPYSFSVPEHEVPQ